MRRLLWLLPAVLGLAVAGWFYRENRGLRAELEAARRAAPARGAAALAAAEQDRGAPDAPPGERRGLGLLGRLRAGSSDRPELPAEQGEGRAERRRRRQEELRAMLGREPGETVEQYRARVAPMVQTALAVPRARLEEARAAAEKAAGVTDEQRAELDAMLEDVEREAMALTNQAIAAGDLTPYERNYAGVLSWSGGLGAILSSSQARIGEILRPDQLRTLSDQGFEWAEYLGVTVPWEQLDPPPPPGDGDI